MPNRNTFGFRFRFQAPKPLGLETVKMDLFNNINSVKFSNCKNDFQQTLDAYVAEL